MPRKVRRVGSRSKRKGVASSRAGGKDEGGVGVADLDALEQQEQTLLRITLEEIKVQGACLRVCVCVCVRGVPVCVVLRGVRARLGVGIVGRGGQAVPRRGGRADARHGGCATPW